MYSICGPELPWAPGRPATSSSGLTGFTSWAWTETARWRTRVLWTWTGRTTGWDLAEESTGVGTIISPWEQVRPRWMREIPGVSTWLNRSPMGAGPMWDTR